MFPFSSSIVLCSLFRNLSPSTICDSAYARRSSRYFIFSFCSSYPVIASIAVTSASFSFSVATASCF
uniref:Kinesin, putative n=1 Tax=Arundo donax TaxID=35708 RepID=A0A0A9ECY7_ARUDO